MLVVQCQCGGGGFGYIRQGLCGDLGSLSSESGEVYAEMSASGRTSETLAILGIKPLGLSVVITGVVSESLERHLHVLVAKRDIFRMTSRFGGVLEWMDLYLESTSGFNSYEQRRSHTWFDDRSY